MTRVVPPFVADERATYTALLDYLRATIELEVGGLTDAGDAGETLAWFLADHRAQCDISLEVLAGLELDAEVPSGAAGRPRPAGSSRTSSTRPPGHLDVVRELLDGTVGDQLPLLRVRASRGASPAEKRR